MVFVLLINRDYSMRSPKRGVRHFISEPISVYFSTPPVFAKKPPCPDGFSWRNKDFKIMECLSEWKDFSRSGRSAHNMQETNAQAASQQGSWGVGKYFFDVRTDSGENFRIYFDRAPKDAFDREGHWILFSELANNSD
jgi:hypothetical protein